MDRISKKGPRPVVTPEPLRNTDEWQDREDLEEEVGELTDDHLEQVRGDEPGNLPSRPRSEAIKPSQIEEAE